MFLEWARGGEFHSQADQRMKNFQIDIRSLYILSFMTVEKMVMCENRKTKTAKAIVFFLYVCVCVCVWGGGGCFVLRIFFTTS